MRIVRTVALLALLAATHAPMNVAGAAYEITVTRKSSNIYHIAGKKMILQTRYCYVYAYSEEAILKTSGYGGELIFIDSKDKCDVKAAYGPSAQRPGKYAINVSREDDDWYEVRGQDLFIKTSMCLALALGQDAFLSMNSSSSGRLIFDDGNSCMVEGVYGRIRL